MKVAITGFSGFVGKNIIKYLSNFKKNQLTSLTISFNIDEIELNCHALIHCAGKAHDLKNTSTAEDYYRVNTELTNRIFDAFLASEAKVFITLSSIKAVADWVEGALTEEHIPNPITHYGKSKLLAEQYILSKEIPQGKRVYILRPCMIYGPGNKGNLNLLYNLAAKGLPWPLGAFDNKRSFCSIENLCFIIKDLIEREDIPSGVYNVADDEPLSTNELIGLIAQSQNRNPKLLNFSKKFIKGVVSLGDKLNLPFNSESLHKLTSSYVVSNAKIKAAIGKPLPVSSREGLFKIFQSFIKQ